MTNKMAEDSMLTEASDDCAESDLGYLVRAVGKGEIRTFPASRQAVCILRRAMKEAMKNNWIPVTDRLPEDDQECWTFSPRGPTWPHDCRVSLHRFRQEEDYQLWDCMTQGANFIVSDNMITHWQPLERPQAPGE